MIRRLLMLCVIAAFYSASAFAVGLGKLELRSALNQRFDAEVELTSIGDLAQDEILPGLGSPEDFKRVGIERSYMLTDLRFKVVQKGDGRLFVQISSTRPVIEPFLNFIVEVLWPNGRILREYTVLLDPPVFGEEGIAPLQPAATQAQMTRPAPRPAAPRETTPSTMMSSRDRLEQGSAVNGEYGMTGPGDTLWAIAMKVRPNSSISVQQAMLAIRRANPEAFINDNINLLKAGHVLRIPDAEEMRRDSREASIQEVQAQNEAFAAYKGGAQVAQLDASGRQNTRSGQTRGQRDDGELRLVATDTTTGQRAGTGGDASVQALSDDLAVAREDLDRARRANSELNSRLADLEEQMKMTSDLVTLKDDQLATLRAQVQKMQAVAEAAPRPAAVTTKKASDSLLTNPMVLIGLGVVAFAGLLGGLFFMKRKKANELADDEFSAFAVEEEDDDTEHEYDAEDGEVELAEEEEDLSPQTSDPIAEAEIYVAYGKFPEAIQFLQNAIEAEPDRADLKLKLLEVFVETEDTVAFDLMFEELQALGDADATRQATRLQQKLPGASPAIEADDETIAIDDDDDEELSFDLDDLDAETEEEATLDLSEELEDDAEEMDLELSLDDDDDDELDLDMDLTVDSAEEDSLELDTVESEDDEISLELDDDGAIELNLDDDDEISLDFGDDDLNLDDDDGIELNLDEDASTKLDLARAYIDMGDNDGAKTVLEEVVNEGSDAEVQEANELLAKIG